MENELRDFFLTVVNYPLGGNADKYVNTVQGLTTPGLYMSDWMIEALQYDKQHFVKTKGPYRVWAQTVCVELGRPIEGWILTAFEASREMLVSVLDSQIAGEHLSTRVSFEDFEKIKHAANRSIPRQPEEFGIEPGAKIGRVEPQFCPASSFINFGGKNDVANMSRRMVFNGILGLACYCLMEVMTDSQRSKIRRCPYCKLFFPAKDAKRKICYDPNCMKEYHRKDMKSRRETDPVKYC